MMALALALIGALALALPTRVLPTCEGEQLAWPGDLSVHHECWSKAAPPATFHESCRNIEVMSLLLEGALASLLSSE